MFGKFLSEHYINQIVDVYCGQPSNFSGKVLACADEVLTLETSKGSEKTLTHISIPHIIAVWKKK